jgi:predicted small lipoprotein YifL
MQTLKISTAMLICAFFLCACGLKGPLYLPGQDPSVSPPSEEDSPLNIDSTDDTQVKKKKSNPG